MVVAGCGTSGPTHPPVSAVGTEVPADLPCPSADELRRHARALTVPGSTTKKSAVKELVPPGRITRIRTCEVRSDGSVADFGIRRSDPAGDPAMWDAYERGWPVPTPEPTPTTDHMQFVSPLTSTLFFRLITYADGSQVSLVAWTPGAADGEVVDRDVSHELFATNGHTYCVPDRDMPLGRACSTDPAVLGG